MDLNFSFSPSPNKRTRQTTGLDRLEPNFTFMLWGVIYNFKPMPYHKSGSCFGASDVCNR